MTIKEQLSPTMNNNEFQNPGNKPVEELKLKYKSSDSSYEESIPALDQRWCNKDLVFTLYKPPPCKNSDGEYTLGSKEDWLERMSLLYDDMNCLLHLEYHRFWSEAIYNKRSLDGLSSFLQNAPPFYLRDQVPQDRDILKAIKNVQAVVFLVLMRLTRTKESEIAWMKKTTLGSILYNHFIISLPQLMEVSVIYANDNFKDVTELIDRVIEAQPKYINDIAKSAPFIFEVFLRFESQLSSADVDGDPSLISSSRTPISPVETVKLIYLMLDISCSLSTFLEVCPQASTVFHTQQLEHRIASFYENTISVLNRHLESNYKKGNVSEQYKNYQFKVNLSRHNLISTVHRCLTACLSLILEERDNLTDQELKQKVDSYLNTISECLVEHSFIRDYNAAFPIQRELTTLSDIYPDIDTLKCEFIVESVLSLCDLPVKKKKIKKSSTEEMGSGSSTSMTNNHISQQTSEACSDKKVAAGVELQSLITQVKDILPHLGDGFVSKCLEHFNFVSADVINAILEGSLPDSLASLDHEMPLIPPEFPEVTNGLPERVNVFDNDEFDVMTRDRIDTSRVHKGKRQDKHKNMFEMLDDKSHVNQLRDLYTQLSLVETVEHANEYEDEYDDTYDDVDVPVGNEGDTETEERRAFVIPRVLQQQQQQKLVAESSNYDEEDEEEESEGAKADQFIENPADIRARAEQRRQEMRGRGSGRSRAAFSRNDVVGKSKGQGQEKEVVISREYKNTNKAFRGNHNRRAMAAKKRRQGLLPS
uniref:CUE domain-containing protein n=1 Tax=Graphocephala atropunctata TaxID=36148 RepID=A0A1B6LZ56_9HEMI